MKDFLAESCFAKGWESVDRNFRRISDAARAVESGERSPEEIARALERLSSQVDLFADQWLHFQMRVEAMIREYNLPKDPDAEPAGPVQGGKG